MRVYKFLLNYSSPFYLQILGIIFSIIILSLDNSLKPYLIKKFIDIMTNNESTNPWLVCLYYSLLQISFIPTWIIRDYCTFHYTMGLRLNITDHFLKRFYLYSYNFFQNQFTGNLISKFNDIFKISASLVLTSLNQFAGFIILIISSLILLANIAPIFAISMLAWVIIFTIVSLKFMNKGMEHTKNNAASRAKLFGFIADYVTNILNIKSFVTCSFELLQAEKLKQNYYDTIYNQNYFFSKYYALQGILTSIYTIGFIVFLIISYKANEINPGSFALVVMLNFNIIYILYDATNSLRDFIVDFGTLDEALSVLENLPEIQDEIGAKDLLVTKGEIVFDKVSFHYKNTSPLFSDKSIIIDAKQKVGLVGYSGSGKTTFVNLVLRLYDIKRGSITIDGQDIKKVTQDSLRKNIAIISQDPSLFHRSIIDNIRYGNIEASDEQVIEAAKKAHAHEFIDALPEGYESLVGERGIKLSGGQRQRIAIARAILKNAPILILDEATSQLDSITEGYIQESLLELMSNKTTIIIAHRLSTLLHLDRILVFDSGKIVQDGTHQSLLARQGLYQTMWNAQVNGFLPQEK